MWLSRQTFSANALVLIGLIGLNLLENVYPSLRSYQCNEKQNQDSMTNVDDKDVYMYIYISFLNGYSSFMLR